MQTEFNGTAFRIDFLYSREMREGKERFEIWGKKALGPGVDSARVTTYCNISVLIQGVWKGLSTGFLVKDRRDKFDKAKGQKLALSVALSNAGLSKQARRKIWDDFFATHKAGNALMIYAENAK